MLPRHAFLRAVVLTALFSLLVSCGGGGGGGGGDSTTASGAGGFTLSTSSLSFTVRQYRALPPAQHVMVQLTDNKAAAFGAAYVAPQQPVSWLSPSVTGSAPNYDLALAINSSALQPGTQVVTLTVGTADSAGNVLQSKPIQITLNVIASLTSTTKSINAPGFILGSSAHTQTFNVVVTADPKSTWSVTSNKSWIKVPASTQTGTGAVTVTVDSENLDVGAVQGSITIANTADPADNIVIPVTADVALPTLTVSPSTILLGGAEGLDLTGNQVLQISLNTGTNPHSWNASVSMASGTGWLGTSATTGTASATATNVTVNADRNAVVPGTYTGSVQVSLMIGAHPLTQTIPVTLNKEGHWINVSSNGVAFSRFPSRSVLTRDIQVVSSLGRTNVPWTAQSNKPWLTVTPSGLTGGTLTLTANPTGQPTDQSLVAEVLVKSSDGSILNEETIRVGLWVGNTDPTDVSITTPANVGATNPVEPYLYSYTTDTDISVYNVYSAALVNTFHNVVAHGALMTISTDGTQLFVTDHDNDRIVQLDAATGAEIHRFPFPANKDSFGLGYARPSGQPILMIGEGSVFNVQTGERYTSRIDATWYTGKLSFAADGLSRYVYVQNIAVNTSVLNKYSLKYTALGNGPLIITTEASTSGGQYGQDLCVIPDASRVYTANSNTLEFRVFSGNGLALMQTLPAQQYPSNVACGWNGIFVAGIDGTSSTPDVWVYRPDGTEVTSFAMRAGGGSPGVIRDTLVLSGDNTRLIGVTDFPPRLVLRNLPPP